MKTRSIIITVLGLACSHIAIAQKMTVKDDGGNVLMEVNDEGDVGSITLPSGAAPVVTTNKLYNVGGVLYWNGSAVGDITAVNTAAGSGLTGGVSMGDADLAVNFAGTGSATTVSRSDHDHNAAYYTQTQLQTSGSSTVHWNNLSNVPAGVTDAHSLDAADGSPTNALYVDNDGEVGIGTTVPNSKLEVAGTIHSTSGGVKFPDNTTQATAAIAQIGFGAWESRNFQQQYWAATDGFAVGYAKRTVVEGPEEWVVIAGMTSYILRIENQVLGPPQTSVSIILPVKKGEPWQVNKICDGESTLYWIPLGN